MDLDLWTLNDYAIICREDVVVISSIFAQALFYNNSLFVLFLYFGLYSNCKNMNQDYFKEDDTQGINVDKKP